MSNKTNCPGCNKSFNPDTASRWQPFCCERCQLIDLGAWMDGRHRIADEDTFTENDETRDLSTRH